jgi:chromosome partitioning protein
MNLLFKLISLFVLNAAVRAMTLPGAGMGAAPGPNVYVFVNQKGGVTKTTTAMMAAVMAWLCGKRVLLVDMDPQGNATEALGFNSEEQDHTVYTLMQGNSTIGQALKHTYIHKRSGAFFDPNNTQRLAALGITNLDEEAVQGPDLLPNNLGAATADIELQENPEWGTLLRKLLAVFGNYYDEIYIDTNPSLGRLTVNSLYAATHVVIPMTPEVFSRQGMQALMRTIHRGKQGNPGLQVAGIVFTRVKYSSHQRVMANIREVLIPKINEAYPHLALTFFKSQINESAGYGEAALRQSLVVLTDPTGPLAVQNWSLYLELMERTGGVRLEEVRQRHAHVVAMFQASREPQKKERGPEQSQEKEG